jgi:hypothetical protein
MRLVVTSTGARLGACELGGLPYLFVLQGRAACPARRVRAPETGENTHWSAVVKVIAPPSDRYGSSVPDGGIGTSWPTALTWSARSTRRRSRHHFDSRTAARITQLLDDQPTFMEWLARLPETLRHRDAALGNLFAVSGPDGVLEAVGVDWEKIGVGPSELRSRR